jgi:hypothetical protein
VKRLSYIPLSLLIALLLFSCEPEEDQPGEFRYPLKVGNTWDYEREVHIYSYQDSSGTPEYEDTSSYLATMSSQVTGIEMLLDSLEVYAIRTLATEEEDTYHRIDYYEHAMHGLYLHAYAHAGTPAALPKAQTTGHIQFKGRTFRSFRELVHTLEAALPAYRIQSDSLYYEQPAVKALHYPLEVGVHWTYRFPRQPWRIDKQVLDKAKVQVPAGTFNCYQIQWLYDMDHDNQWDEDITIYDDVGRAGLVRRRVTVLGSTGIYDYRNESGYLDYFETSELTDVMLE